MAWDTWGLRLPWAFKHLEERPLIFWEWMPIGGLREEKTERDVFLFWEHPQGRAGRWVEDLEKCPGQTAPGDVDRHKSRSTHYCAPVTESSHTGYSNNWSVFSPSLRSCSTWPRALGPVPSAFFQWVLICWMRG